MATPDTIAGALLRSKSVSSARQAFNNARHEQVGNREQIETRLREAKVDLELATILGIVPIQMDLATFDGGEKLRVLKLEEDSYIYPAEHQPKHGERPKDRNEIAPDWLTGLASLVFGALKESGTKPFIETVFETPPRFFITIELP